MERSKATIGTSVLEEGIPVFYTYKYKDKSINFFVLKTEGKVLSYFDACAKCFPAKKGYRFEDGRFICNFCNHGYSINTLGKGIGGCYPLPLKGELKGEIYEISQESIIEGGFYF